MNAIGVSSWIWLSPFTDEDAPSLVARAQEAGAEVLEVAVEQVELVSPEARREERERAVEGLRAAADYAAPAGVSLAIEPLDRFETDMVNTTEQGLELCEVCANDRGTPGTGHLPWADVFSALRDVGYGGQRVIESFTPSVGEIAKAVSLWRPLDASGSELARKGVAFLRSSLAASEALQ
jgi:D-psicose/D-tagatose/L-ribulose 3-epimerase